MDGTATPSPEVRENQPMAEHTGSSEISGYREILSHLVCETIETCYRYRDCFGLLRKPAQDFPSQVWKKSQDAKTEEIHQELQRHWLCSPSLQQLLRVG